MIVAFALLCLIASVIGVGLIDMELTLIREGRGSRLALLIFVGLTILTGTYGVGLLIEFFAT